jgi:hypothetical protein
MTSEEFNGKLVIVFAGYTAPLAQLLKLDPGLTRRFTARILFEAVEPVHAEAVLVKLLGKQGLKVAQEALTPAGAGGVEQEGAVARFFRSLRDKNPAAFGNLGDVDTFSRKLFEAVAARLMAPIEARAAAAASAAAGSAPSAAPERPVWDKVYTLADVQAAARGALQERPEAQQPGGGGSRAPRAGQEQFNYEGGAASSSAAPPPRTRAVEATRAAPPAGKPAAAEEEEKEEEEQKAGGGGGAGGAEAAAPNAPPRAVSFALQGAFQKLGLANDAAFRRIMREGPQGGQDWGRLAEATRKDPAVAALQNAEQAVQEALEWCASNLAASEREARELDESRARLKGLENELNTLLGSAAAATEEGRREQERVKEALRKAQLEAARLAEEQKKRAAYCNYCGRPNTPYSGCAFNGKSDSVSYR